VPWQGKHAGKTVVGTNGVGRWGGREQKLQKSNIGQEKIAKERQEQLYNFLKEKESSYWRTF
jgi:hypothetical protein